MAGSLGNMSPQLLWRTRSKVVCLRCCRMFATTPSIQSGHNKWSKIKHDKGRKDQVKTVQRTQHVQAITLYSRMYGPDPKMNSSLAHAIAIAKKASMPKDVIEQAVARGQGRSLSGAALESMKFEVMMPPSAAFILEVETDNKLRSLQEVNNIIRKHKGRTTATDFFFNRIGRVVFERHESLGVDDIMDEAIEAGAEDLEADEEGNIIVTCQPAQTTQIAQSVANKFDLKILDSEITWSAKEETQSKVDNVADVTKLSDFVGALTEVPEVQGIYCNAIRGDGIPEEEWASFEESIDS
ncbi:hypothetical protein N0V93_004934 [Gnomoniopsis smithogilvyi]|uniref:Uncharacterized protein n=1 Tax=Gnomoniopsis smithogilvyi TaxID=1191159 RepID=A0A9W8YVM1_9PEZI|nr:hypothetical protein N0V93_004934 [Gnomoniopsis smithogilvyi]